MALLLSVPHAVLRIKSADSLPINCQSTYDTGPYSFEQNVLPAAHLYYIAIMFIEIMKPLIGRTMSSYSLFYSQRHVIDV